MLGSLCEGIRLVVSNAPTAYSYALSSYYQIVPADGKFIHTRPFPIGLLVSYASAASEPEGIKPRELFAASLIFDKNQKERHNRNATPEEFPNGSKKLFFEHERIIIIALHQFFKDTPIRQLSSIPVNIPLPTNKQQHNLHHSVSPKQFTNDPKKISQSPKEPDPATFQSDANPLKQVLQEPNHSSSPTDKTSNILGSHDKLEHDSILTPWPSMSPETDQQTLHVQLQNSSDKPSLNKSEEKVESKRNSKSLEKSTTASSQQKIHPKIALCEFAIVGLEKIKRTYEKEDEAIATLLERIIEIVRRTINGHPLPDIPKKQIPLEVNNYCINIPKENDLELAVKNIEDALTMNVQKGINSPESDKTRDQNYQLILGWGLTYKEFMDARAVL